VVFAMENCKMGAFCTLSGILGSMLVQLFGGWSEDFITLLILMVVDFITGIIVAGIFKNSSKTKTGSLQSNIGLIGLCKKCMVLFFVLVANRLDMALNVNYVRTTVIIGFIVNECVSITENAGLMGVPLPEVIVKTIEILKDKKE